MAEHDVLFIGGPLDQTVRKVDEDLLTYEVYLDDFSQAKGCYRICRFAIRLHTPIPEYSLYKAAIAEWEGGPNESTITEIFKKNGLKLIATLQTHPPKAPASRAAE